MECTSTRGLQPLSANGMTPPYRPYWMDIPAKVDVVSEIVIRAVPGAFVRYPQVPTGEFLSDKMLRDVCDAGPLEWPIGTFSWLLQILIFFVWHRDEILSDNFISKNRKKAPPYFGKLLRKFRTFSFSLTSCSRKQKYCFLWLIKHLYIVCIAGIYLFKFPAVWHSWNHLC